MKDTGERLIPKLHSKSITYGEHLARYRCALGVVKDKIVLDIACGTGYGTQILAERAAKVYGIDVSQEAVEYAAKNYPRKNIIYKQGDAVKTPLPDSSVDVVISLETIEHIPAPEPFVKEVKRVLKPGGVFVVSTPNDDEFTEGNIYHVHEFDFKTLDKVITKNFKNFEYYFQGSWFSSGVLSKKNFEGQFSSSSLDVVKTFEQKFDKSIFYMAVASDASLVELQDNLVVADVYSAKNEQENSESVKKHIDELNQLNRKQQETITKQKGELAKTNKHLEDILNSRTWKLALKVQKLKPKLKA